MLEYLAKSWKNPNLNLQDNDGMTALHVAVKKNQMEAVEILATNGADLNVQQVV